MYSLTEEREIVDAAEIEFRCGSCLETNLTDVFRFKTVDKYLGIIPIWTTLETTLKCQACDATFRTKTDTDALRNMSLDQLSAQFRLRIELVEKFLVVAGWLLFFTGPVAIVLFLIAWLRLPKASNRWRSATRYGFIAALSFFPIMFTFALICDLLRG